MRYIGSKLRLLAFIEDTIKKYCGEDLQDKVFCDIFAGTGVVGKYFSPKVKRVIANDFEKYSYVANYVALKGYNRLNVARIVEKFNELPGTTESSLYDAYAENGKSGRLYFSDENGQKIAAARKYLTEIQATIDMNDYIACLLSIMEAANKVSNTMSTYGAYAKKLKDNSLKPVVFTMPDYAENASENNEVYSMDSNKLISQISGDILYLDPPYNGRQYGSNYHVLNSLAKGWAPDTDSITGLEYGNYNKSDYCRKGEVGKTLDELIKNADFEWIFMSYNNEGLLSFDNIREIMEKYGTYSVAVKGYQRYKADNKRKQAANSVIEFIHVLHKGVFDEVNKEDALEYANNFIECMRAVDELPKNVASPEDDRSNYEPDFVFTSIDEPEEPAVEPEPKPKRKKKDDEQFIVSPMNYMGGKKKLIKTLKEYFPKDVDVFVDLFCGGATVGINADAKTVIFNDNLKPLIWMYLYMYNHTAEECVEYIDSTIAKYGLVQGEEGRANYYKFRDEHYNKLPVEERHPLDLFVLMAYSFNNQIRFAVNKNWKFNIPFGANRSSFNGKMRENLINFINALHEKRECLFSTLDFRDFEHIQGMFVYADPPYLISQATYNDGWDESSEIALLDKLLYWDGLGVKFALSNVLENKGETNTILKEWAESHGFNIIHLDKSYANSYYQRKEKDSKTDEVLIVNY